LGLILCCLRASGNCVVTANRGALQGVCGIFRRLPYLVVLQVLRHVLEVVLFAGQHRFKNTLSLVESTLQLYESLCDARRSCQSSVGLNFRNVLHVLHPDQPKQFLRRITANIAKLPELLRGET
jgi:hypothetical protein